MPYNAVLLCFAGFREPSGALSTVLAVSQTNTVKPTQSNQHRQISTGKPTHAGRENENHIKGHAGVKCEGL